MSSKVPTPVAIPTTFATVESRAEAVVAEIESHLKSFSLATLQKIDAAVTSGNALPSFLAFLEPYRKELGSFLDDAIIAAQLAAQVGLISAVPVSA